MNDSPAYHDTFIFDQRTLVHLPYGLRTSDYTGCGWIAAYNAHLLLNCPISADQVRKDMARYLLLGGWNGTPFHALVLYFKCKGFRVHVCPYRRDFHRQALHHTANIIFYLYLWGGHFTTLRALPNGLCQFYNDLYGVEEDHRSMRQFLCDHKSSLPKLMISIDR